MIRFVFDADNPATKALLHQSIERDIADGKNVILLVPEQETVSAERRLLQLLSPTSQLQFEVSNFTRLANRIFRTVGGLCYHYATPGVSALLMWKTLHTVAPLLRQYGTDATRDLHLTDRMLSAVAQFKAYCVTPEELLRASDEMGENDPLRHKLFDLGLISSSYNEALSGRFADMADDLSRAAALVKEHPSIFSNTAFYVDSFTDFTGQELQLLRALLGASLPLTVTLALSDEREEKIHLTSSAATYRRLFAMAKECGERVFTEKPQKADDTPSDLIRTRLFDTAAEPVPLAVAESGFLHLTLAASPFEEAEYAAFTVQRLVREGCRYRDIAIILRDAGAAVGIIDAALEKNGIPFFLSERKDVTLSPLIKLILFALRIRLAGWQAADVVGYLKTGLCPVSNNDINCFEAYAELWRLKGAAAYAAPFLKNPDGYTETISERGKRILAAANRVREAVYTPLSALFAAFDGAKSIAEMCHALYDFLTSTGIPDRLKEQAAAHLTAGDRREAEELSRLWDITVDALESIARTIGEDPADVKAFSDALRLVFQRTDIGSIPTSADEVLIGSASTLRTDRPRFAIVLGLNEGQFPATVGNTGLLSDAEKRRLAECGITLSADSATAASDELFYACRALSLPREALYLSYAEMTTEGKKAEPSLVVDRIRALFPTLTTERFEAADPLSRIYAPAPAAELLPDLDEEAQQAVLELLSESKEASHCREGLLSPVTDPTATVSKETAATLFGEGSFYPTGLEKFASCSFAYYCSQILRLREEPSDALSSATVGVFMHHILEHAFLAVKEDKKPLSAYTEEEIDALVARIVSDYRDRISAAGDGLSPRASALTDRLAELARLVITSLFAEFADSLFVPAFLELNLREIGSEASATLQNGTQIPLSGKVDRVDLYRAQNGAAYLRVADYKTGRKQFRREDISKGFCLQMPLYLYALCKGTHPTLARELGLPADTRFSPAGVTYLSTAVGSEKTPARIPREAAMRAALGRMNREGVLLSDPEVRHAMSLSGNTDVVGNGRTKGKELLDGAEFETLFGELADTVGRISSQMKDGAAHAEPHPNGGRSPCDFCAFGAVCRTAKKTKKGGG